MKSLEMIRTARRKAAFAVLMAFSLATTAACGDNNGPNAGNPSNDHGPEFGDFGYSDIYRYYGGPSAVVQEFDAQRRQERHSTQSQPN